MLKETIAERQPQVKERVVYFSSEAGRVSCRINVKRNIDMVNQLTSYTILHFY